MKTLLIIGGVFVAAAICLCVAEGVMGILVLEDEADVPVPPDSFIQEDYRIEDLDPNLNKLLNDCLKKHAAEQGVDLV